MMKNPAGLVRIGNQINVEYMSLLPNVTLHTEGALANAGLRQKSRIGYIPAGNAGISYYMPDTFPFPVSIGVGGYTLSGLGAAYPESRLTQFFVQKYDRMLVMNTMRTTPTVSMAINDRLSVGLAGNIDIGSMKTDLTTSAQFGYRETTGSGKWDHAYGGGFTAGILYRATDMVALGASYESQSWMSYFDKYKDVLHYVTQPQVINLGVSVKPVKKLELTFDTRWIDWLSVKAARRGPIQGGFGWKNQWVLAAGGEFSVDEKLKLRGGYNYAPSPIKRDVVFANALVSVIMEHHLTTGFSYALNEEFSLDFAWEHHFMNAISDNGEGDSYSQNGNGTKMTASADVIGVGITWHY
jgi:long-chain fatty acid transport protein